MSVWFEGEGQIECDLETVKGATKDFGALFVGVVTLMPGMSSVELVDQTGDSVTIRTNEGLMERTGITRRSEADRVVLDYEERYEAGGKVTATSHFSEEFAQAGTGVSHRLVIRDVEAPGLLGSLYRRLGSSKMGKAFLAAYKGHFEARPE